MFIRDRVARRPVTQVHLVWAPVSHPELLYLYLRFSKCILWEKLNKFYCYYSIMILHETLIHWTSGTHNYLYFNFDMTWYQYVHSFLSRRILADVEMVVRLTIWSYIVFFLEKENPIKLHWKLLTLQISFYELLV